MFIALVAYIGRSGYRDAAGDGVSFLDALYYASVSVTTTGYGDIAPAWRDVDPPVARTKRITLYTLRGNPRLRRVPIRSPARPQFLRTFDHSSAV